MRVPLSLPSRPGKVAPQAQCSLAQRFNAGRAPKITPGESRRDGVRNQTPPEPPVHAIDLAAAAPSFCQPPKPKISCKMLKINGNFLSPDCRLIRAVRYPRIMRREMAKNPAPRPAAALRLPAAPVSAAIPFRLSRSIVDQSSPPHFAPRNFTPAPSANSANPPRRTTPASSANSAYPKHAPKRENFLFLPCMPVNAINSLDSSI